MKNASRNAACLGLLCATAIVLSFLEGLLPALPFLPPGAKAGFSNIITMFAASFMGLIPALTVAIVKSLFVLLTHGGVAFCMSLAGGLLSAVVSYLCLRGKLSLIMTGVLGALTHNTAQLLVAVGLTGTPYLFYYAPPLMVFAGIAGTVTGVLLKVTYPPLKKVADRILF